jgi:hypothetical protein
MGVTFSFSFFLMLPWASSSEKLLGVGMILMLRRLHELPFLFSGSQSLLLIRRQNRGGRGAHCEILLHAAFSHSTSSLFFFVVRKTAHTFLELQRACLYTLTRQNLLTFITKRPKLCPWERRMREMQCKWQMFHMNHLLSVLLISNLTGWFLLRVQFV